MLFYFTVVAPNPKPDQPRAHPKTKKSLRPTSDQLVLKAFRSNFYQKQMNFRPGPNNIRFSVSSKYQGTREVRATAYLWPSDTKVVISDIDGTITK